MTAQPTCPMPDTLWPWPWDHWLCHHRALVPTWGPRPQSALSLKLWVNICMSLCVPAVFVGNCMYALVSSVDMCKCVHVCPCVLLVHVSGRVSALPARKCAHNPACVAVFVCRCVCAVQICVCVCVYCAENTCVVSVCVCVCARWLTGFQVVF